MSSKKTSYVGLGSHVTIRWEPDGDEETFIIVEEGQNDPSNGRISYKSPIGQGLLATRLGEEVEIEVPTGVISGEVINVTHGVGLLPAIRYKTEFKRDMHRYYSRTRPRRSHRPEGNLPLWAKPDEFESRERTANWEQRSSRDIGGRGFFTPTPEHDDYSEESDADTNTELGYWD